MKHRPSQILNTEITRKLINFRALIECSFDFENSQTHKEYAARFYMKLY